MAAIYLIIGGPAAGKSTTARALADRFPRSIHVPVDDLRDMVAQGRIVPASDGWSDGLVEQIRLARETAVGIATRYAEAGFVVVLDDFWDPLELLDYRELMARPPAKIRTSEAMLPASGADARPAAAVNRGHGDSDRQSSQERGSREDEIVRSE